MLNIDESPLLENKLNRIADIALRLQSSGLFIALVIVALRTHIPYAKNVGQTFALFALICSAIISRIYIRTGKKLEELKTFSPEEGDVRKNEYFLRFCCPYLVWAACYGIFSHILTNS